jgi:hypothetical protein
LIVGLSEEAPRAIARSFGHSELIPGVSVEPGRHLWIDAVCGDYDTRRTRDEVAEDASSG